MASTVQLKRRIKTAQNISKTTRALNMIATSKLKRAQDSVIASRPYEQELHAMVFNISKQVETGDRPAYMVENKAKQDLYIVISPDKGLCGGMIANLGREFLRQVKEKDATVITVGKKIEAYAIRSKKEIAGSFPIGNTIPSFQSVNPVVAIIDELYLSGKVKNVYVLTTHFKNVFTQEPQVLKLLPVKIEEEVKDESLKAVQLFEPDATEILPGLLRHYIEVTIYQKMLENYASFQSAQMTAMKNATDNANEIIEELKLVYNKTRQERITSELLDISGSAMAN